MRLDPQESLTEMDKDRNMKNRIRGQVMYLNSLVVKKASKEIKNRKPEASKNVRIENDRFTCFFTRKRFTNRSPPMDFLLRLKEILLYKT